MNWDRISGNWKELTGDAKRRWGKLIDGQLDLWAGKRDHPKQVAGRQAPQQEVAPPKGAGVDTR